MQISEIKKQLRMSTVLSHYGLKPDRNNMVKCPFHDDKNASMKYYPETDTVYCFGGSCKTHKKSIDVIDFIGYKEDLTKRESMQKCVELITGPTGNAVEEIPQKSSAPLINASELFAIYQKELPKSRIGKTYLQKRGLEKHLSKVGYKNGRLAGAWGKNCLIVPLRNEQGEITSLYGRHTTGDGHFYQTNRSGLYPKWPERNTKQLILTESIIDAMTLEQIEELESYSILALYGTNGLTNEHERAICELAELEEIIWMFDGDEAGRTAVKNYVSQLKEKRPNLKQSSTKILEGEDVNSLWLSHESPELFIELIAQRQCCTGSPANPGLDTANPQNLIYQSKTIKYSIKGGIKTRDLDSLKVTLCAEKNGKRSRVKTELYDDYQIQKAARQIGARLQTDPEQIAEELYQLTDQLETYRESQKAKPLNPTIQIPESEKKELLKLLKSPTLLKDINQMLASGGIIGEENNRLFLLLIATSNWSDKPLHALIQGESGEGKTHLMHGILDVLPEEQQKRFTRVTDGSLYNWGAGLKHKTIGIEDYEGLKEDARFALRELQSNGNLSSSTSEKEDEKSSSQSKAKVTEGPISSLICTTQGELYEDNVNRCFLLRVDSSEAQTERIMKYQQLQAAGKVNKVEKERIREQLKNLIRILQPQEIINPFAEQVSLPNHIRNKRRLTSLLHDFILQITYWHQYQRPRDSQNRIQSTPKDIEQAIYLIQECLLLKSDDLNANQRKFYERLKKYIEEENKEFKAREVRQSLRLSRGGVATYLKELTELEYLRITGGSERSGYTYVISYWDDYEVLKAKIAKHVKCLKKDLLKK